MNATRATGGLIVLGLNFVQTVGAMGVLAGKTISRGKTIVSAISPGFPERLYSNHYSPYIRPGGLEDLKGSKGFNSFDCRHAGKFKAFAFNGYNPECVEQKPWGFKGEKRSFPHVERAPHTASGG